MCFLRRRKAAPSPAPAPAPAPQPQPVNDGGWFYAFSRGAAKPRVEGKRVFVDLTDKVEVDMVLRPISGPLKGRVVLKVGFTGDKIAPTEGNVATASLILCRKGNKWGDKGEQRFFRFYYSGAALKPGESVTLSVPLTWQHWHGVVGGEKNEAAFAAMLADIEFIGVALGDPAAGATAHGVQGVGTIEFTLEVVD